MTAAVSAASFSSLNSAAGAPMASMPYFLQ